jgi:lipopolysaccharide heptosyltransferase I
LNEPMTDHNNDAVSGTATASHPASILVIRLGAIGDVIRTIPAVSCLRKSFPDARIAWAVETPSRELLQDHPDIDDLFVLNRRLIRKWYSPAGFSQAIGHWREFTSRLAEQKFEWVIDLHGNLKSATLARSARGGKLFGFGRGHTREKAHLLYGHPVSMPKKKMSRTERALAVSKAVGANVISPRRTLPPFEEASKIIKEVLQEGAPRRPRVLVYPGTSQAQSFKRFPADRLAHICDELVASSKCSIVIGWGPGEHSMAEELQQQMICPSFIAPRTSLRELAEMTRESDLFIGSDTGPMHLAAAVGTPLIALYGPTDPLINVPYTDAAHLSFVGDVKCRPCRYKGCRNRSCLKLIDLDEVTRGALKLLDARNKNLSGGAP